MRKPSPPAHTLALAARCCDRCDISLLLELTTVNVRTPDGERQFCAACARVTLDRLDAASIEAKHILEDLWRVGSGEGSE